MAVAEEFAYADVERSMRVSGSEPQIGVHEHRWLENVTDQSFQKLNRAGLKASSAVEEGDPKDAIIHEARAIDLKRGIDAGVRVAFDDVKSISRPVQSRKERAQVAAISAHNDSAIGELVADAMEKVGPEGATSVEEAKGMETALEIVEGTQFDRGFLSPYFITDPQKMETVLDDPLILLYERKISNLKDLLPLLETIVKMPHRGGRRGECHRPSVRI